jgi:hypothetical protein
LDEKSAFRPCGRDLVEFFNNTGWALYDQVAVPMRLPDAGRLPGSNLPHAGFWTTSLLAYDTHVLSVVGLSRIPLFLTTNSPI